MLNIKRFILSAMLTLSFTPPAAAQQFISMGTGSVSGVYYPTGFAICRLVNKGRETHGIRCSARATSGSVFNINALKTGQLSFGIAQSDWQYHALNGSSTFKDAGQFTKLRALFSVHAEPFTLIARADSDINDFMDLRGKRVHVGNPGSGQRATMEVVMQAMGLEMNDLALAAELKDSEMTRAICSNQIDAMIYTIGHPAAAITEVADSCAVKLVKISGDAIDKLVADNAFYRVATIPGGMYRGNDTAVTTFGVGATVISTSDVPKAVAYNVTKAVFDQLDAFKQLHPALANLQANQMIKDGLSAPLHAGAAEYYKERGWSPD